MDPKTKQLVKEAEALVGSIHGPFLHDSIEESDIDFLENAPAKMVELCSAIREQDKRARHAEEERDLYSKRIDELEAQIRIRDSIIESGNKLRHAVMNVSGVSETLRELATVFGMIQCKGVRFTDCACTE